MNTPPYHWFNNPETTATANGQFNPNNWQQRNHATNLQQYQHQLLLNVPKSPNDIGLNNGSSGYHPSATVSGFSNSTFDNRSPITVTHNQALVNAYQQYQQQVPFCYPPTPPKDALIGTTPTLAQQKLEKCDKLVKVESVLSPESSENESRNINKEMSEDERRKFYNDSLEDDMDENEETGNDEDFDDELQKSSNSIDNEDECNEDNDETSSLKSKGFYDWHLANSANEWQKSYMGKPELDTSNTKANGSKKKAIPGFNSILI